MAHASRISGRAISITDGKVVSAAGLIVGLGIRLALLHYRGTADTFSYEDWGRRTQHYGLAKAYGGIYFPLQYQILATVADVADHLHVSFVTTLKAVDLACDVGCLTVIAFLLRRFEAPTSWAVVYWIHPYTLALYWLSYIDFQIGFLLLLCLAVLCLRGTRTRFLLAGVPLGAAFVMKPQLIVLVGIMAGAAVFASVKDLRPWGERVRPALEPLLLLVGPAAFFIAYTAYFYERGFGDRYLLDSYVHIADVMPSLSANMPNIWYPIAWLQQKHGEPIYDVIGPHVLHTLGAVLTIGVIASFALIIFRRWEYRPAEVSFLLLLAAAALVAPMVETRAHENHLYLGWILGVVVAGLARRPFFTWALVTLAFLDSLNLFGIYAFGLNHLTHIWPSRLIKANYHRDPRLVISLVAIGVFVLLLVELYGILLRTSHRSLDALR